MESIGGENKRSSSSRFRTPEERAQLVAINREIALCANRKDIHGATAAFQRATTAAWANSHTFSAMINAYVRCGDIDGAFDVFTRLKASTIKLDVVSCTTMMKGYCSVGDIGGAVTLLHEMKRRNIPPNVRTINTLIRGCLSTGTNRLGHNIFTCMKSVFGVQPDSSSWEYEVFMLCQGLQLDKVLPMIGRLSSETSDMTHSMSAIFGAVAKAASLRGEWALARKYMKMCSEAMAAEMVAPRSERTIDDDDDVMVAVDTGHLSKQAVVGGKRSWKEMDQPREQSLEMYREHKRAELRQEMQLLESFISRSHAMDLFFYERVLSFDPFNECLLSSGVSSEEYLPLLLLKNLIEKFGLDCFLQRKMKLPSPPTSKTSYILNAVFRLDNIESVMFSESSQCPKKAGKKKKKHDSKTEAAIQTPIGSVESLLGERIIQNDTPCVESILRGFGQKLCSYFSPEKKIDFSAVFGENVAGAKAPVRLEICSGGGEWAAQQARSEAGVANWVTLEVKQDRVYQSFLRMVFHDVRNLCVISGDAVQLLPRHFSSASVSNIFINHPEPPVQYGGHENVRAKFGNCGNGSQADTRDDFRRGDSYGKHLLTLPFFEELERVLQPGGTITLVTDNLWYGKLILRSLSTLPHPRGLQSVKLETLQQDPGSPGHYSIQEEASGHILYKGRPGIDCGHSSAEASSYFDRLWNRDNQPERYFFLFQKVNAVSGISLRIAPKGNMSRMKNVPDNLSTQKTFAVVKTGTKIKFED